MGQDVKLTIENEKHVPTTIVKREKLLYLESIRGLAAFIVAVHHFSQKFITPEQFKFNNCYVPDFIGHFMVVIFFLLSGRVLAASCLNSNLKRVGSAFLRRPLRLGLPLAFVLLVCYFVFPYYYDNQTDIPTAGLEPDTPNMNPRIHPTTSINNLGDLFVHFVALFSGSYMNIADVQLLNQNVWTIPIEYSGSNFIYTLSLIVMTLKKNYKWWFLAFISIFAWWNASYNFLFACGKIITHLKNDGHFANLQPPRIFYPVQTLLFLVWISFWFLISFATKNNFALDSYSFLIYEGGIGKLERIKVSWFDPVTSFSIAGTAFLILVETNTVLQRILSSKPLIFLGRISFSLYLSHPIMLYGVSTKIWRMLWFGGIVGYEYAVLITFAIYTVLFMALAYILTILIDEPTVKLARWMAGEILE